MLIFAGLGNPGGRYARNRHNIGFMAVEEIARLHRASPWKRERQGEARYVRAIVSTAMKPILCRLRA